MEKMINVYFLSKPDFFKLICLELNANSNIFCIGSTEDFEIVKKHFLNNKKDVLLIKIDDFSQNEVKEFLEYVKSNNIKNIAICKSVREGFNLLNLGAGSFFMLLNNEDIINNKKVRESFKMKIRSVNLAEHKKKDREYKLKNTTAFNKIVFIGASTGGTNALEKILIKMPKDSPPILIVQHMPPVFTKIYAERLHELSKISVWEAEDGDEVMSGLALIAPGDKHLQIFNKDGHYYVSCDKGKKINGHCPSVNLLFESAAKTVKKNAIGVILTGMGKDGATGMLEMKNAGAFTIGQDENTSVVYGMPKAAFDLGAILKVSSIEKITELILEYSH